MEINLTDEQRQELIKILQQVYTEEELQTICRDNKEKFGGYLYDKVQGKTANTRFSSLVDYLISKNLIESFLEVCLSNEVNQQTQLNQFYQDYQKKIKYEPIFDICNFKDLISILHKINQNKLVITLYKNYQETYNEQQKTILEQKKDYLSTNQQPEYLIINELLILIDAEISGSGIVPDSIKANNSLTLRDFIEKFLIQMLAIQKIDNHLKEELKQWIESNFSDIVFPTKNTHQSILESYLLIIIYRKVQTRNNRQKRFGVRAEFIEKFSKTPNIKVELNQEDIKEQGYLEKEIPNIIYKFIEKVIEKVNDSNQLKIEFFLPIDCLTKEFEFRIPEIWKREGIRLCEKFWLILRPFERHYYHCNLSKANDKVLRKISYDTFKEKLQRIQTINEEHIVVCNQKDNLEKKQLKEKLDRAIIIQISCGLPTRPTKKHELFQIIFEHGIPICLWFKKEKLDSDFNSFLEPLRSEDTNKLYEKIFDVRKQNLYKDYRLGVLCDINDNRVPINWPNFNPLKLIKL